MEQVNLQILQNQSLKSFSKISSHQKLELQTVTITTNKSLSFFQIFKFADIYDYILMIIGTIAALINGTAIPLSAYVASKLYANFVNTDPDILVQKSRQIVIQVVYVGIGAFISGWIMLTVWIVGGQRQSKRCKQKYFEAILNSDIGWFDKINQNELTTQFFSNNKAFQQGISQKIPNLISLISMIITALFISFIISWQLTLIIFCMLPIIFISSLIFGHYNTHKKQEQIKTSNFIYSIIQQKIGMLKTIKSLNSQNYQNQTHSSMFNQIKKKNSRIGMFQSLGAALMLSSVFLSYGLSFLYGQHLIRERQSYGVSYDLSKIFSVVYCMFWSCEKLNRLSPCLKKISLGKTSAQKIIKLIDQLNQNNYFHNIGIIPLQFKGVIKFENVTFSYPKNPQKIILKNLSFQINQNIKKIAFVGDSGCGKSTIFQLLLRFYQPNSGIITIDDINIKQINIKWLRNTIGYIGQQPSLFSTTIRQNLLLVKQNASIQQITHALIKSRSYDFIQKLQKKLDTHVGTNGNQLSGGQKQRIAIGRVLLKKPKMILFDQATSALDRQNQRQVQQTINELSEQLLTITIAHRISTICQNDLIFVLKQGKIIQKGKFKDLQRYRNSEIQINNGDKIIKNQEINDRVLQIQKQQSYDSSKQTAINKLLQKYSFFTIFKRLSNLCPNSLHFLNILTSIGNSITFCLFSICLAKLVKQLVNIWLYPQEYPPQKTLICIYIISIAVYTCIITFSVFSVLQNLSNKLAQELRKITFNKVLKLQSRYLDNRNFHPSILTSLIEKDCLLASKINSFAFNIILQTVVCILVSFSLSFYFQWRITLITLSVLPIVIFAMVVQMKYALDSKLQASITIDDQIHIINESILGIKTVRAFGIQKRIIDIFKDICNKKQTDKIIQSVKIGFFIGLATALQITTAQILVFIGTTFIRDYKADYQKVLLSRNLIYYISILFGCISSYFPDIKSCIIAAASIFNLLDMQDEQQNQLKSNSKAIKNIQIKGQIEFKNVSFKYPSRNKYIFQNFSMKIQPSSKTALVGYSGCGKSTIMQILMRYYDIQKGEVLLDGINIKDYDIYYLRSIFGIVSQQPHLFNKTIKQNLQYSNNNVTYMDIQKITKKLNIFELIEQQNNLPNQTIGVKGSHISGGQKQRLCIARMLLRLPRIILLDEATSALDSKNEKLVIQEINEMSKNLTVVTIAHRFQTIKQYERILVFMGGKIIQEGKYNQLIKRKSYFYNMQQGNKLQDLKN